MLCWQTVPEGTVVSHADFVRMKADELASYDSARREERQRRYVSDANMITRAMAQLAAQGGETADVDRIQEVLHDLLREYGQRAEFAGLPPGDATVLSAFIGAETQMLDTATARLHSCSRPSKAERQAYGRRITIPAQPAPAEGATAGAISESSDQTMSRLAPTVPTALAAPNLRKTLGWITAASAAAARAEDDAAQAAAAVAAAKATNDATRCAALAALPMDVNTHYRDTNGVIHTLPPGCGPLRHLGGRQLSLRRPRVTDRSDRATATAAATQADDARRAAATATATTDDRRAGAAKALAARLALL